LASVLGSPRVIAWRFIKPEQFFKGQFQNREKEIVNRFMTMRSSIATFILLAFSVSAVQASDAWRISEIFSSSDGQAQYIKLGSTTANQHVPGGLTITASFGGVENVYTFPDNPGDQSLLIGTQAFVDATGLAVDYVIPPGFLPMDGGSLDFAGVDSISYGADQLPLNGIQALRADGEVALASPVNFAGNTADVEIPVAAFFDDSSGLVYLPVVDVPGLGTVNARMQLSRVDPIEFTLSHAVIYDQQIIPGNSAARLENQSYLYIPSVRVANELYEVRMRLLGEDPIRFGHLDVISVIDLTP